MVPVIVFGSINMDLVARTPRLPQPGETVVGYQFASLPGGKGANQAVAAARLGAPTCMVGCVGGDRFGHDLLSGLRAAGVNCDRVRIDPSTSSGVAIIEVDDQAENHIVIIPGANGTLGMEDVGRLPIEPSRQGEFPGYLLLQLEIPLTAVVAAAQTAHRQGAKVILDPAPAQPLPSEMYSWVDILTPNQVEAAQLVGFPVHHPDAAKRAAAILQERGSQTVIIKMGKKGAYCTAPSGEFWIPAFSVTAVDTVAAGDAFNGGLAAALVKGLSLRQAVVEATAVAALSVTQPGAQVSMPSAQALQNFLAQNL
ncbi:MAG: ribokinase [Synechococcales bacterium]|nr:ribokinase [Synechococcales bacterium]